VEQIGDGRLPAVEEIQISNTTIIPILAFHLINVWYDGLLPILPVHYNPFKGIVQRNERGYHNGIK